MNVDGRELASVFHLPSPARRRRRWWRAVQVALVLGCLAAACVVWQRSGEPPTGLAGEAVVTASSTAAGFSARDVVTSGRAEQPGAGWESAHETVGAWIELNWAAPVDLHEIVLVRNPPTEPGVTDGFVSFGDGSSVQVRFDAGAQVTRIPISRRSVSRMRFTASAVSPRASGVHLDEVLVNVDPLENGVPEEADPGGNSAAVARVEQGVVSGTTAVRALIDGSTDAGPSSRGRTWSTPDAAHAWIQFDWPRPRELASVEIVGNSSGPATLAAATLTFADGAQLPVGAVLRDPELPTVVGFMPRVTTSVRLSVTAVDGSGALALSELRIFERGSAPARVSKEPAPTTAPADRCADRAPTTSVVIRCPVNGSSVGDTSELTVDLPTGYTSLAATPWPAGDDRRKVGVVRGSPDSSGEARIKIDLAGLPAGPFMVEVVADGPRVEARTIYLQLDKVGGPVDEVASDAPSLGRTLVYAEEFDGPVSLSRTGLGAEYAAAKPVHDGAEDFGDAVFADPDRNFGNVSVTDDRYLRIQVEPLPAGFTDPDGGNRSHLGGLIASARTGGSGFAAQYGYFEARMLAPAAPGTWPAFWMLPADNLVEPTPVVAEIDAVELYGHDPRGACHSTHEYIDGTDGGVADCGRRFGTERAAMTWHTYGVAVSPTAVTYYIDGRQVATAPQVDGGNVPLFFLVDLALGGGWPVDLNGVGNRATLWVDHVRVYV